MPFLGSSTYGEEFGPCLYLRRIVSLELSYSFWGIALLLGSSAGGQQAPLGIPAIRGIVADFSEHPVVIIGEAHWLREAGDFYIRLVHDPEFQRNVQDIVVEFASRNNQPLLDRVHRR